MQYIIKKHSYANNTIVDTKTGKVVETIKNTYRGNEVLRDWNNGWKRPPR